MAVTWEKVRKTMYLVTGAIRCRSGSYLGADWSLETSKMWGHRKSNIFRERRAEIYLGFSLLSSSFQFKTM